MKRIQGWGYLTFYLFIIIYPILRYGLSLGFDHLFNSQADGLYFFYIYLDPSDNILFYILLFTMSIHCCGVVYRQQKESGFTRMIITRQGFYPYLRQLSLQNIKYNALLYGMVLLLTSLSINLFCSRFSFQLPFKLQQGVFMPIVGLGFTPLVNWCVFLVCSFIGFLVFSQLLFYASLLISNLYLYRASGFLLSLILTALPAMIHHTTQFFPLLWCMFYLPALLSPGAGPFGVYPTPLPPLLQFISCFLCYVGLTLLIRKMGIRHEYLQ